MNLMFIFYLKFFVLFFSLILFSASRFFVSSFYLKRFFLPRTSSTVYFSSTILSWWPPCSRNPTDWLHLPAGLSGQERRVVVVRRRRRSRTSTPSRWRTGGRRAWSTSTTTSALLPEARRARRLAVRVDGRHHLCVQRCRPRTRWCPRRRAATAATASSPCTARRTCSTSAGRRRGRRSSDCQTISLFTLALHH